MAVRLSNDGVPGQARWLPVVQRSQQLGEGMNRPRHHRHARIVRQQLNGIRTPHGHAAGLHTDDRNILLGDRSQHLQCVGQLAAGPVQLAGGDPGQPAAGILRDDPRRESHADQQIQQRYQLASGEGVGERIDPDRDRPTLTRNLAQFVVLLAGGTTDPETRHRTPLIDTGSRPNQIAQARGLQREIAQHAQPQLGDQSSPARQPAQRIVRNRTQLAPVLLVEHPRLVGSHVDAGGAVATAALAGQAQLQGFGHLGRGPAPGDQLTVQHLLQDA